MCVFLFFLEKLKLKTSLMGNGMNSIYHKHLSMNNMYQKHFFIGALKNRLKFLKFSRKKSSVRSRRSQVFCNIGFLENSVKPTKKHQCWSQTFNKVSRNKDIPAKVFPCRLCETFQSTFFTEHLRATAFARWSLSLKKLHILGVHLKVVEETVANKFLFHSKSYLPSSCISISCFQLALSCRIFFIICFFLLKKFLNNSALRKVHSIKLSGSGHQKVLCPFIGEIFRYES